jgi:hypothetical protein
MPIGEHCRIYCPGWNLGTNEYNQHYTPMPLYFFDVRQSDGFTSDTEGEELAGIDAAEIEVFLAAIHLAKELLSVARSTLAVEVRDEQGQKILRATVTAHVERL